WPRPPSSRCRGPGPWACPPARSRRQHPAEDERDVDQHRDRRHHQRGAAHARAARGAVVVVVVGGGHGQAHVAQWVMSPWARSPSRITGGRVKVWCGAGEGTVHSRPLAPSQTRAVALAPLRLELHRIANIRKGVMNMPNAPIELTRFQSANTTL